MTKARLIGLGVIGLIALALWFIIPAINQYVTRNYGGSFSIDLPPGFEVRSATWGEDNLWYLVENPTTGETMLLEDSRFGGLQGRIIFNKTSR